MLNGMLADMGMPTPFGPDVAEFFRDYPAGKAVYCSSHAQKAFVDINEKGTGAAAAAATGTIVEATSFQPIPVLEQIIHSYS